MLAGMTGLLAWIYLDSRENEILLRGDRVRVLAAKRHISAFTRLRASDLQWREIPSEYVVKGYIQKDKDALGQVSLVAFNAGEPLTYNKLSTGDASLSNSIPEGKRAMTIPVNKVTGLEGMLRPGDLVDLLYLDEPGKPSAGVSILLQGVKILASGNNFAEHQEKNSGISGSATLALSPQECELVMLAVNRGTVQLSLRSTSDTRVVPGGTLRQSDLNSHLNRPVNLKVESEDVLEEFVPKKR